VRWSDLVVAVLCAAALCECISFLLIAITVMHNA